MKEIFWCIVFLGVLISPGVSIRHNAVDAPQTESALCLPPAPLPAPTPPRRFNCRQIGNKFTGSCDFAVRVLNECGVTDDEGKKHPGYSGWTLPHFNDVQLPNKLINEEKNAAGETCKTLEVSVQFTAAPIASGLDWQPDSSSCNTCSCKLIGDSWRQNIIDHEQRHVSDATALAQQWTNKWVAVQFTSCSRILSQGLLSKKINNAIVKSRNDLLDAWDQSVATAHAPPNSKYIPLYCSGCAPCVSGQSPTSCKSCEKCENGGCVPVTCSYPQVPCCGGNCCGLSKANQPIACCLINGVPTCSPLGTSICP